MQYQKVQYTNSALLSRVLTTSATENSGALKCSTLNSVTWKSAILK